MHKYLIFFLWLTWSSSIAQQDTTAMDAPLIVKYDERTDLVPFPIEEATIKKYQEDSDFNYYQEVNNDNWWNRLKRWLGNVLRSFFEWLFGKSFEDSTLLRVLFQLLPYLFIAGCIAFVIWLVYKLNPGAFALKSKEEPQVFFSEDEEIINSKNIKELIEKALLNKDYRLAVRYYYLLILKKLKEAGLIEYEFDKTNSDYLYEISETNLKEKFGKISLLYDYIWYGSFDVSKLDYDVAKMQFEKVEQLIPTAHE